nr:MAG TPA: protein of unknown function DUF1660 [Herelleviridae sp.]
MLRRLWCHLFGHKVTYVFTTRRRSSGCRASHWSTSTTFGGSSCKKRVVPVFYKCCSRCGKKLSRVSRYWGDPVV